MKVYLIFLIIRWEKSYDLYIDDKKPKFIKRVYFIGTKYGIFEKFNLPKHSTVIDPFRIIPKKNINLIRIGDNIY